MHSLYSGVRQPSFSSGSTKLSERRPRKTAKTRYEDIYPELSYAKALELSGLLTLYDRREAISAKLFHEMCANQSHRLHKLLPNEYQPSYSLREQRTFIRSKCKTERSKSRLYNKENITWPQIGSPVPIAFFLTPFICMVGKVKAITHHVHSGHLSRSITGILSHWILASSQHRASKRLS